MFLILPIAIMLPWNIASSWSTIPLSCLTKVVSTVVTSECEGLLCNANAQKYVAQTAQLLSQFPVEIDRIHFIKGRNRVDHIPVENGGLKHVIQISTDATSLAMTVSHEFTHIVLYRWRQTNQSSGMTRIHDEIEWAFQTLNNTKAKSEDLTKAQHVWTVVASMRNGFEEVFCDLSALSAHENLDHYAKMSRFRNYGGPIDSEFVAFFKKRLEWWDYDRDFPADTQYQVFGLLGRHLWQKHLAKASKAQREFILFQAAQTMRDALPEEIARFRTLSPEARTAEAVQLNERLTNAIDKALVLKTPKSPDMQDMVDRVNSNSFDDR